MDLPPLALVTAHWPGIGGRIKEQVEDFEVEEIPAYEPSGSGEHLYLWVQKRDLGAEFFQRQIAQRLGVSQGDIGTAGLKDRRAVTRQWVSVPAKVEPRLAALDGDGIAVLKVTRHGNKLRTGHLRGNRFRVLVRGVGPDALAVTERNLDAIRTTGLLNYYGPQRFGRDGETAALGFAMLRGQGRPPRNPFLRKLALSAAQSVLFNAVLSRRMTDGLSRNVLLGDAMAKLPAGGLFVAEDVAAEQARMDARETMTAGPMFGAKLFPVRAAAAEREAAVLNDHGLTPESFAGHGKLVQGTRRHNIVYVDDAAVTQELDGLRLTFTLPAGSYATVLLLEIMKTTAADDIMA